MKQGIPFFKGELWTSKTKEKDWKECLADSSHRVDPTESEDSLSDSDCEGQQPSDNSDGEDLEATPEENDSTPRKRRKGPVSPTYYLPLFRELCSELIPAIPIETTQEHIRMLMAQKKTTYRAKLARAFGITGRAQAWR